MKRMSPIAIAIVASLIVTGILIVFGGSIAGSYVLMQHYVQQLAAHQLAEQLKAGAQTCRAIRAMDLASKGAQFSSHGADSYGHKLAAAIHSLYVHSACPAILSGHYRPGS